MRKIVLAAVAATTVLGLSACKGKEAAPEATETAATEAAPAETAAATDAAATEAAPAAAGSEAAPKM